MADEINTDEPCDIKVGDTIQLREGGKRTFTVGGVWWDRTRKCWLLSIHYQALGVLWHCKPTLDQVRSV